MNRAAVVLCLLLAPACTPGGGASTETGAELPDLPGATYVPAQVEGWTYAPPRPDGSPAGLWQLRAASQAGGQVHVQYDAVSEAARAVTEAQATAPAAATRDAEAWRARVREVLRVPPPITAALDVRVHDITQVDGVRIEAVDYVIGPNLRARGALLVPTQVPPSSPAVLFLHGHGISPFEAVLGAGGNPLDAYQRGAALAIAQQGHVVFAPEIRSFGESGRHDFAMHEYYVHLASLAGRTALGDFVADGFRAAQVLRSRPEVADAPVVTAGISLGGELAWLVAALDEDIDGAYVAGALGTFADVGLSGPQCSCQYPDGAAAAWDVDAMATMVAPRPLWLAEGADDLVLAPAKARDAGAMVTPPYAAAGASDGVRVSEHAGAHVFDAADFAAFAAWFGAR